MTSPNVNQSLASIFNVELTTTDKTVDDLKIEAKVDSIDTLESQRNYVRENLVRLLEKGAILLDNMTTIANSTESGKDFQAANDILKTLVATNVTLLDCEVAHKPSDVATLNTPGAVTNNTAVFVGSTSDLSKYLQDAAKTSSQIIT
jgi:hypothetical protein